MRMARPTHRGAKPVGNAKKNIVDWHMRGNPLGGAKPVLDCQNQRMRRHHAGHGARRLANAASLGGDDIEIVRPGRGKIGCGQIVGGADRGYTAVTADAFKPQPIGIDGVT